MALNAEDVKKVISAFENQGIVTRLDCVSIDSREVSKKMALELRNRGYENAINIEVALEKHLDYSYAIFDVERFDIPFIQEYMKINVLSK